MYWPDGNVLIDLGVYPRDDLSRFLAEDDVLARGLGGKLLSASFGLLEICYSLNPGGALNRVLPEDVISGNVHSRDLTMGISARLGPLATKRRAGATSKTLLQLASLLFLEYYDAISWR